jgi:hypothetical protein
MFCLVEKNIYHNHESLHSKHPPPPKPRQTDQGVSAAGAQATEKEEQWY